MGEAKNEIPLVELKDISKSFPGVKALENVSFKIYPGECLALAGENGAGKSTLSKIILGIYTPTKGEIFIQGKNVTSSYTIKDAQDNGLNAVHQELQLVPELTGYENIFLGSFESNAGFIKKRSMRKKAQEVLDFLKMNINLNIPVKRLRMAEQQIIQLAKALVVDSKLIILDELTAVLQEKDIQNIYRIISILKEQNISIIYISHRLDEIFEVCDTYTVLVDGNMTGNGYVKDINKDQLIEKMIGRELTQVFPEKNAIESEDVVLKVNKLTSLDFKDIDFTLKKGEIIGIAGLVGAGKTELLNAIFGNHPIKSGTIDVNGKRVSIKSPLDAIKYGIGLVPDERKALGLTMNFDINQNMTLAALSKFSNGFMQKKKECDASLENARRMNLKYANLNQSVRNLSGGNQQKVVIAKWLIADSEVLMFDEPTRGIDVGAKAEIYKIIMELALAGKSIIIVSPELEELIGLCHRVHIMFEGRIRKSVQGEAITQENIINSLLGESS